MDPEIPGLGTYAAPGWFGASQTEPIYRPPSTEATTPPSSPSQVPGTSGAPGGYTPSPTPGGVATGGGTGTASTPWGNIAGLLGLGGGTGSPAPSSGPTNAQRAAMQLAGWRMLQAPGT